ncbi:MAG: hypothetical protein NTX52_11715 [Planctomycetota bacterium]|nr:hypothetical protein [Planctomycetota bacterium]
MTTYQNTGNRALRTNNYELFDFTTSGLILRIENHKKTSSRLHLKSPQVKIAARIQYP